MSLETKTDLNAETIDQLQKLIRANIDAHDGLREAAEQISDQRVAKAFLEVAKQRSAIAADLQKYVEWNGQDAEDDGSVAASVHRAWMTARSKFNGGDPYVVLVEAERGEDSIKSAYEGVLKETTGSAMNDVLQEQFATVKAGHDRIRDLRELYKTKD